MQVPSPSPSYAEVIVPLPVPNTFTYLIPEAWQGQVAVGCRVVIPFGKKKRYSGLVKALHNQAPLHYEARPIEHVLDPQPLVTEDQLWLWDWIANYYLCTPGEVMAAALPNALILTSETRIVWNHRSEADLENLSDREYLLYEALEIHEVLSLDQVSEILGIKTVYPVIRALLDRHLVTTEEEIREKYKPRLVPYVRLTDTCQTEEALRQAMDNLQQAPRQTEVLMCYIELSRFLSDAPVPVRKTRLQQKAGASAAQVQALADKGILEIYDVEEGRVAPGSGDAPVKTLTDAQQTALEELQTQWQDHEVCLLHGVTSSGKTEVYIRQIEAVLEQGKQVLYLLPEIALTTQMIQRLQRHFGPKVGVYHSRFNQHERVEIWKGVLSGSYPIVLGARSALLLPFQNLGLVIVDEEHESSFKQRDPAPRYHARDTAIVLAQRMGAKVLLGSATPSMESYFNATQGKYGLTTLSKRFGDIRMPEITVVDLREERKRKTLKNQFSSVLLAEMEAAIARKEQVILFQNRRGFSPFVLCTTCGWSPECERCDIGLTYHKYVNKLKCHYCGFQQFMPQTCPACGSASLQLRGFGTEKIEEDLALMYPDLRIKRMDLDTTRGKHAFQRLINELEDHQIDVLVGTQMVTKGLDFENVGLVGILHADSMLHFPDFRAHERSFQLMTQVAGRAGRKKKQGKVVIQTYQPQHPIISLVLENRYEDLYTLQTSERLEFSYPPYFRLIRLTLSHRDKEQVLTASDWLGAQMREAFGQRVLGPEYPVVARINNRYLRQILLKVERNHSFAQAKEALQRILVDYANHPEHRKVRVIPDVDPH